MDRITTISSGCQGCPDACLCVFFLMEDYNRMEDCQAFTDVIEDIIDDETEQDTANLSDSYIDLLCTQHEEYIKLCNENGIPVWMLDQVNYSPNTVKPNEKGRS